MVESNKLKKQAKKKTQIKRINNFSDTSLVTYLSLLLCVSPTSCRKQKKSQTI